MRKSIFVAFVAMVAALALGALPASADHTDNPSGYCGGGLVAADTTPGENSASVCVAGIGATTVAQTGDTSGVIVVDGDNDNALTDVSQCLDGHAAVVISDGGPDVQANDGEFDDSDGTHDADYFQTPASEYEGDPNPAVCAPE